MQRMLICLSVLSVFIAVSAYGTEETTWAKIKSSIHNSLADVPAAKATVTVSEFDLDWFGLDLLSNGETGIDACGVELYYDPDQRGNLFLRDHFVELPNGKTILTGTFRESSTATAISTGTAYEISGSQNDHFTAVTEAFTFNVLAKPVDGPGPIIKLRMNGNMVITPSGQANFQGEKEGEACSGP